MVGSWLDEMEHLITPQFSRLWFVELDDFDNIRPIIDHPNPNFVKKTIRGKALQ